ncbi:hypothetical protein KKC00_03470 [Patescibacteria group bacterium]|nr:hypothetical protein [Patescibacteria group bacterium]
MKRLIFVSLVLIMSASVVFAQGGQQGSNNPDTGTINSEQNQQGQGTGQGQQIQTEEQTQNQGEEGQLIIMQQQQVTTGQINEVKNRIQQRKQEMNQEMQSMGKTEQKVYQNQNQVRSAVRSLLEMKDIMGGIGSQVSQIAQEFDNSVQATIRAEEKIQARSRFVRFFIGGDQETAELIKQEVDRNKERTQQLAQLREQCACDDEVKVMLQEQISNIEQEQNRLEQVVQTEKQARGLFGWLFGWLRR